MRFTLVIPFVLGVALAQEPTLLTLSDAEAAALKNHPRLSAAALTAQAAGQGPAQVRASYYPSLTANLTGAGVQKNTAIAAGNVTTSSLASRAATGVAVNQMLFDFGRTAKLAQTSELKAGSQRQNVAYTRAQVLLRVQQSYHRALMAQSILTVAQETVSARKLTLKQVAALAKSNLKSSLDVSFAEVSLSEAELSLFRAENDIKAAMAELSAAMGYETEHSYRLKDEPLPAPLEASAESAVERAFKERPDLAGVRLNRDAARSFAESEKKLWLPSVSVIGAAGVVPGHDERLRNSYSGVGVNLSIPILNGGLFSARRAEAEFKAQAADQEVRDSQVRIARDVRLAWLSAENAFRRLDVTARLLDQANRTLRLAQARYDLGLGSIVELTQAQLAKTSAEIVSASARYEYQIAHAALDYESGALK